MPMRHRSRHDLADAGGSDAARSADAGSADAGSTAAGSTAAGSTAAGSTAAGSAAGGCARASRAEATSAAAGRAPAARPRPRRARRAPTLLTAAALAAAAVSAAAPIAAHAAVVSSDGITITVQGTEQADAIVLSVTGAGAVEVDAGSAGPGCTATIFGSVQCPLGAGGVVVATAGGDDQVMHLALTEGTLPDGALRVDLGAGSDEFRGADRPGVREAVSGGPGADRLAGGAGDDLLDGGDGNDELTGDGGRDELRAGPGDDLLDGDRYAAPEADVIDGGPGSDRVEGWAIPDEDVHPRVSVTLDGAANDGRPGEGDDVREVERVVSHVSGTFVTSDAQDVVETWSNLDYGSSTIRTLGGDDVVTAGSAAETIDGGAGDDRIEGGFGDDRIVAGPGRDTVVGDKSGGNCGLLESCSIPLGNDTIDVRDGAVDSVTCGDGTDAVEADPADTVAADCEQVVRGGSADGPAPGSGGSGPGGGGSGRGRGRPRGGDAGGARSPRLSAARPPRLGAALARGLVVRLAGAPASRRVAITARAGRRGVVARGSARTTRAGAASVRLRFTPRARTALRGARTVRLTVAGGGARTAVSLHR